MGVMWLSKKINSVGKLSAVGLNVGRCGPVDPDYYVLLIRLEDFWADFGLDFSIISTQNVIPKFKSSASTFPQSSRIQPAHRVLLHYVKNLTFLILNQYLSHFFIPWLPVLSLELLLFSLLYLFYICSHHFCWFFISSSHCYYWVFSLIVTPNPIVIHSWFLTAADSIHCVATKSLHHVNSFITLLKRHLLFYFPLCTSCSLKCSVFQLLILYTISLPLEYNSMRASKDFVLLSPIFQHLEQCLA